METVISYKVYYLRSSDNKEIFYARSKDYVLALSYCQEVREKKDYKELFISEVKAKTIFREVKGIVP